MRRVGWLLLIALAAGAGTARAQSTLPPIVPPSYGQPTANVTSTLTPRTPPAVVTEPTTPVGQPGTFTPYPATGYPVDKIIFYPALTAAAFYDDNVFARNTNRQGDWAGVLRPEFSWRSNNWTNMEAAGAGYVEQRWYNRFSSEDQLNAGAIVGGTLRPGSDTQVVTRLVAVHAHEDRGTSESLNAPTLAKPIAYDQVEAAGAINQRYGRVWTSVGAGAALVHYNNAVITFAGGSLPISQGYRNGTIATFPFRIGYVVAPLTSVFLEVTPNNRNFQVDAFDSQGYRVAGGMLFEPGPGSRIKGEFFAGYMSQSYSGAGFNTISTWTMGSSLAFLLTPELTATLESRRIAAEASLSGGVFAPFPGDGVSVIDTMVAGRFDWLVAPKTVLGAGVAYLQDDFLSAARTDRSWSPLASVKYFVNPNLTLGFDYRYLTFDSSGLGVLGYYRNVFLLSANLRM